jgi:Ras-related protein Rab-21
MIQNFVRNTLMSGLRFKIVLLGEGRVGKTSILLRYTKGEFNDRQVSTLQASYLDKKIMIEGSSVQLSVWDTAGQERFHALGPIYYRDADGALLVYDVTDAESFNKVKKWVF